MRMLIALTFALCAAPAAARQDSPLATPHSPLPLLYERTLMTRAGERCALFSPPTQRALAAAAIQARGAALRAGTERTALAAVERRAATKAAATPCASPELALAAARVRDAFAGYASMNAIPLEGWTANRAAGGWRLKATTRFGFHSASLGVLGRAGGHAPAVVVAFADRARPTAVRLRVRDPRLDPHPDLRGEGPARRLPAREVSRTYWSTGPAETVGVGPHHRLPAAATAALAALDPREAVAVEFLMPGGEIRTAAFPVGDVAAGLAFLDAAPR